jgi:hypothetical protein
MTESSSRPRPPRPETEKRLLTFTIEAEVGFAQPADVHRFTDALARAVAAAAADCGVQQGGQLYRVVVGGHPVAARGGDRQ